MDVLTKDLPPRVEHLTAQRGRRILILDFDLYLSVGGGQSAYQRLIEHNPDDSFYYFRRLEAETAPRPSNATAITFRYVYQRSVGALPRRIAHFFWSYVECRDMAASIVQQMGPIDFDVVDTPDYNQLGVFIRSALVTEGCRVETVALAMHGTLSSAWRLGWPTGANDGPALAEVRSRERLHYRVADARYALSETYAAQWERQGTGTVNRIDPLLLIGTTAPPLVPPGDTPPDLAFVGRREKWKGPDLFLDLAWWVERAAYRNLLLIGPEGYNRVGTGSADILEKMARQRGLDVTLAGPRAQADLHALFATRTLLLLPSRQDTFNLTALEAISRGCPVIVSSRAGVAPWLRERFKGLDWLTADIDCSRTAATQASDVLASYDARRAELTDALRQAPLRPDLGSLAGMYQATGRIDVEARQITNDLAAQFSLLLHLEAENRPQAAPASGRGHARAISRHLPAWLPAGVRALRKGLAAVRAPIATLRGQHGFVLTTKHRLEGMVTRNAEIAPRTLMQINRIRGVDQQRHQMVNLPERSLTEIKDKITWLSEQVPAQLVDRVRLFREMARLERKADHDLVAVTYLLRVMRWTGKDLYGDLPYVVETLSTGGLTHEAEVAASMFGDERTSFTRCQDLMNAAYQRNLSKPDLPLAILDDRRGAAEPRVSAIVSLYNAESKLPTLLATLAQQSIVQRGELEVVLVDSNSPTNEHRAFLAFASANALPIVYARSAERETIQAAWNRGIKLARGTYLTFLGVDEGIHPDALRQLSDALDTNPSADWAMADSLVTNVDQAGVYDSDIMPYDRTGYHQDLTYLDTCYLSWVGGLYRRSIHDRFGYYDESFRAAGDTEFKNRLMPHIRSVHVPRLLGVFNNYPEARTTQSPRAELEDLRAWYLWRSVAGMQYAFGQRPVEDAVRLFHDALSYRKSFCGHLSTDFDIAAALATHLATRPDGPAWAKDADKAMREVVATLQSVDLLPAGVRSGPAGSAAAYWLYDQLSQVRALASQHGTMFGRASAPHYEIFNDNRYEQHWYSWS